MSDSSGSLMGSPATSPRHGEVRHHGLRRADGREVVLEDEEGREVYRGPGSSCIESVSETYCAHCQAWVRSDGVLGPLQFMAQHRDGDCRPGLP